MGDKDIDEDDFDELSSRMEDVRETLKRIPALVDRIKLLEDIQGTQATEWHFTYKAIKREGARVYHLRRKLQVLRHSSDKVAGRIAKVKTFLNERGRLADQTNPGMSRSRQLSPQAPNRIEDASSIQRWQVDPSLQPLAFYDPTTGEWQGRVFLKINMEAPGPRGKAPHKNLKK